MRVPGEGEYCAFKDSDRKEKDHICPKKRLFANLRKVLIESGMGVQPRPWWDCYASIKAPADGDAPTAKGGGGWQKNQERR